MCIEFPLIIYWQSRLSYGHSLSAMQLVQFLQFFHILLQGWVLTEIIKHVTVQSLEGNVNFHSCHTEFSSLSGFHPFHYISYLREKFDMLVFSQEIFAETHPLRHQVQNFSLPLQSLLPVLFSSISLGAIGGIWLRLQPRWRARSIYWHQVHFIKWSMNKTSACVMLI